MNILRFTFLVIILFVCLIFPSVVSAQLSFIPKSADGVLLVEPTLLLDSSATDNKELATRFQKILDEISERLGIHFTKDLTLSGFYLIDAEQMMEGGRPRGAIFATGKLDLQKIIKLSGVKEVTNVSGFEIYNVGQGVAFGFVGKDTILFGGLNEVLAGLMAVKKKTMSGAADFKEITQYANDKNAVLSFSLLIRENTRNSLQKLLGESISTELFSQFNSLHFLYHRKSGIKLRILSSNEKFGEVVKPLLDTIVATSIGRMNSEIESFKTKEKERTDFATLLKGMELSLAMLEQLETESKGKELLLSIPTAKVKGFTDALFHIVLKIFNRNYRAASGVDGIRRCLANMKIIEGAAELSIMDGKSVDRQSVKITTLISNGYITKSPVCPKGGEYELKSEKSGFTVKCSKHGEMDKIYDDLYNPKKMK